MVSDSELVNRLHEILRSSDLNTTTPGSVRRQLQADFGVDLTDRKRFISQQIDEFLQSNINFNITTSSKDEKDEYDDATDKPKRRGEEDEAPEEGDEAGAAANQSDDENGDDDDDEEVEDGSDGGRGKKPRNANEEPEKKRRGCGFAKLCRLSPDLQEFVGVPELARTEVVKKLWAYIREKNLQDPGNRRNINCDEKLHVLFGVDSIDMFQMNKILSKHIWPLEAEEENSVNYSQKEKQLKRKKEDVDISENNGKRKKGGFLAALQLSDALIRFLGTGETSLSRSDVVKRMWEYIKKNNLQDPSDKRIILCDDKLKELFDVEFFQGFTVTKLLAAHFIKT